MDLYEKKLNNDDIEKIEKVTEKYLKHLFGYDIRLTSDKIIQKCFRIKSTEDDLLFVIFGLKGNSDYIALKLPCIKYKDGNIFYCIPGRRSISCGSIDGWFTNKYLDMDMYGSETENYMFYYNYLAKINNSIFVDKPNRSKQITLLYSIFFYFFRIG